MTKNIPEVLFPLFWVDEHFEIDKKNADKFYYSVQLPLNVINIGKWIIFSFGAVLFIVCFAFAYKASFKASDEENADRVINSNLNEQTPLLNNNEEI